MKVEFFLLVVFTAFVMFNVVVFLFFFAPQVAQSVETTLECPIISFTAIRLAPP